MTLTSSAPSIARVPSLLPEVRGGAVVSFPIQTSAVTTPRSVTISASAGGVTRTATLVVNPPAPAPTVAALTLTPATVQGGDASTGEVSLAAPAPSGGATVALASLDTTATVPPSVLVAAGRQTATFAIATAPTAADTSARITATLGSTTQPRTLTITAAGGNGGAVLRDGGCLVNVLPANDDGSTGSQALPFPVNFNGTVYSSLFINNNGNVTFDAPLSTFTPFNLLSTARVIVAPFFGDVDTRGVGSGLVTWGRAMVDGRRAFCANWSGTGFDGVGYFAGRTNKRNTFHPLLVDRSETGSGNFDIEFRYDKVQ